MILDDGSGIAIDTESKPLTLEQQMTVLEKDIANLRREIFRTGRTKERQAMQLRYDTKRVQLKKLRAQAKKKA
jgi:hypothetical protein